MTDRDIVERLNSLSAAHAAVSEGTQGALGKVVSGLVCEAAAEITRLRDAAKSHTEHSRLWAPTQRAICTAPLWS